MLELPSIVFLLGGFILAFVFAFAIIPTIITIVREKNLFDEPNERTSHTSKTPTLGGAGVFIAVMISIPMFAEGADWNVFRYLFVALILIFSIGIKDDILAISPTKKMLGQLGAAFVLVVFADVRISHLHGFSNFFEIAYWVSVPLSILVYIVVINALNFIDGIDGLAASIGILNAITFGTWFYLRNEIALAVVGYSLAGGLVAFFYFNVYSKHFKIFMGDTGSLMIGVILAFMAIQFNEMNIEKDLPYSVYSTPSVTFAIMVLPLFDFFRIIFVRKVLNKGLMSPDRLHLHHRVLRLGISHKNTTYWMVGANSMIVVFGFISQHISIRRLLLIEILLAMLVAYIPVLIFDIRKKRRRKMDFQQKNK